MFREIDLVPLDPGRAINRPPTEGCMDLVTILQQREQTVATDKSACARDQDSRHE